ncbi:MAG TPA: TetR family transcriptional regulator [Acidimicrobiia bacterium]|nr:TetR family transcriptional regulator [Acidimicrobiia bacterium]
MAKSYKSQDGGRSKGTRPAGSGIPAQERELRAQGRRTMRKLFDAGMRVFADRGYHAARVDDIVRAARTSHGTFYLYFANKEDLLRALAIDCAEDLAKLADRIGPITTDEQGFRELRAFLADFLATYRRYGPVIRAWMEDQVADPEIDRLGVKAFTAIGARLGQRMREVGAVSADNEAAAVGALMAMLERSSYALSSRRVVIDDDTVLDTLAHIIQRGFFGAPAS